jgi:hypothetical protein
MGWKVISRQKLARYTKGKRYRFLGLTCINHKKSGAQWTTARHLKCGDLNHGCHQCRSNLSSLVDKGHGQRLQHVGSPNLARQLPI